MEKTLRRIVGRLEKRYDAFFGAGQAVPFAVRLTDGPSHVLGHDAPAFTLVIRERAALSALRAMDLLLIGEAYLSGALDVEGDFLRLLSVRALFRDWHPILRASKFARPLMFGQVRSDARWIAKHYDEDPRFFQLFLDQQHRCYSHGVFESDDEPLERGIERKLAFALDSIRARPGDRVLDVGGGWGAFTEYAGARGIHVTSLTISRQSEQFIGDLIARRGLPCRVLREHLFAHQPEQQYDAIVNLGVTEHLPDYRRTLSTYASLLKPGGRVCLDASAARSKHALSAFFVRHIFPGNGSPVCMHDYLTEVARSPFSVMCVLNDTHNYELTARRWAENLDRHRAEVERRWGPGQYRRFQVYLWGCVDGFHRDSVQAYRWVLQLAAAEEKRSALAI